MRDKIGCFPPGQCHDSPCNTPCDNTCGNTCGDIGDISGDCGSLICKFDKDYLFKIIKCLCILKREITKCEEILCNPHFGLKEIKCEVKGIEKKLECIIKDITSPVFGLSEIKAEVAGIEDAIFSPTYGLSEIKTEIQQILANQGVSQFLTTGPFFADCFEQTLLLKVSNNTAQTQSVTFVIHDLENPTPGGTVTVPVVGISPCGAIFLEVPLPGTGERNIEIRAELSTTAGLSVYAATKTGLPNCQGSRVNEFKWADWVPLATFCR